MRGSEGASWGVPRGWDPGPPSSQQEIGAAVWPTLQCAGDSRRCGIQGGGGGREAIPGRRGLHVRAAAAVRLAMAADLRAVQAGLLSLFIISCRRKSSPVPGSLRHRRTPVAQVSEGLELPFPQNYMSRPSFSE